MMPKDVVKPSDVVVHREELHPSHQQQRGQECHQRGREEQCFEWIDRSEDAKMSDDPESDGT